MNTYTSVEEGRAWFKRINGEDPIAKIVWIWNNIKTLNNNP